MREFWQDLRLALSMAISYFRFLRKVRFAYSNTGARKSRKCSPPKTRTKSSTDMTILVKNRPSSAKGSWTSWHSTWLIYEHLLAFPSERHRLSPPRLKTLTSPWNIRMKSLVGSTGSYWLWIMILLEIS